MRPRTAGWRLILLALPFLAFGLLWALRPPLEDRLSPDALILLRTLGVAMALLSMASIGVGSYLVRQDDERIL